MRTAKILAGVAVVNLLILIVLAWALVVGVLPEPGRDDGWNDLIALHAALAFAAMVGAGLAALEANL